MIHSTTQPNHFSIAFRKWLTKNRLSLTSFILIIGLFSFEIFNYSTTDFALRDLLGDLNFFGIFWSTILAIAFCGIDFAGIASLFVSDEQSIDQKDNWFLFGAWFLAATMNAILTWWGVAMSLTNHTIQSTSFIDPKTINQVVPIFVAIMVWLTRILLIGSFSLKNKNQKNGSTRVNNNSDIRRQMNSHSTLATPIQAVQMNRNSFKSSTNKPQNRIVNRPEPEYIPDQNTISTQQSYNKQEHHQSNVKRF
ncbi:MAG: hypothetical protein CVU46_04075 [Chloroflexi bacterium HGW-Chloroflexi-8]|nr:MAG: hypothetical protein CVU46_04075 [Chloroflexi bacterium HGW-Chloroflexi-8]